MGEKYRLCLRCVENSIETKEHLQHFPKGKKLYKTSFYCKFSIQVLINEQLVKYTAEFLHSLVA